MELSEPRDGPTELEVDVSATMSPSGTQVEAVVDSGTGVFESGGCSPTTRICSP